MPLSGAGNLRHWVSTYSTHTTNGNFKEQLSYNVTGNERYSATYTEVSSPNVSLILWTYLPKDSSTAKSYPFIWIHNVSCFGSSVKTSWQKHGKLSNDHCLKNHIKNVITRCLKKLFACNRLWLCQILTSLQNSLTAGMCKKFAINLCNIFYHASNTLLHYLEKSKVQICYKHGGKWKQNTLIFTYTHFTAYHFLIYNLLRFHFNFWFIFNILWNSRLFHVNMLSVPCTPGIRHSMTSRAGNTSFIQLHTLLINSSDLSWKLWPNFAATIWHAITKKSPNFSTICQPLQMLS